MHIRALFQVPTQFAPLDPLLSSSPQALSASTTIAQTNLA